MIIEYYTKKVFGREDSYIIDNSAAEMIEKLTGRKVLRQEHRDILQQFGVTFKRVAQPVEDIEE